MLNPAVFKRCMSLQPLAVRLNAFAFFYLFMISYVLNILCFVIMPMMPNGGQRSGCIFLYLFSVICLLSSSFEHPALSFEH